MSLEEKTPVFEDLSPNQDVTEIESLCMQCFENGISRFLLTKIPHFREIIIAAFECPHCGFRNNEVQSASSIRDFGVKQICLAESSRDLNRQVVISEHATIRIKEIEFEIPPSRRRGYLNTIEGILRTAIDNLKHVLNEGTNNESASQIGDIVEKLEEFSTATKPFTFEVDDPSGNSYIENYSTNTIDSNVKTTKYMQTAEHLHEMGYSANDVVAENTPEEVFGFNTNCSTCAASCETRMHMLTIPHFKDVVIMSTTCDSCGYKSNEVKSGGAISDKGKIITLKLTNSEDLNRDILKSESCILKIPEIKLEVGTHSLGGRFTTLEGFLRQISDELKDKVPFIIGDSAEPDKKAALASLLGAIDSICEGNKFPVTIILDDPLGNSYLQNIFAPESDPNMKIEEYERSYEQNEEYGLNDLVTD